MKGASWSRVMEFLTEEGKKKQFKSLFSFNSGGPPLASIVNYYNHDWSSPLPPTSAPLLPPSGGKNIDDALDMAGLILGYGYKDSTCFNILSDGFTSWSKYRLDNLMSAIKNFEKTTGCPFCINCYLTIKSYSGTTPLEDLCHKLGGTVFQLE